MNKELMIMKLEYEEKNKSLNIYTSGSSCNLYNGCNDQGEVYSTLYFIHNIMKRDIESQETIERFTVFANPLEFDICELLFELSLLKREIWLYTNCEISKLPEYIYEYCKHIKNEEEEHMNRVSTSNLSKEASLVNLDKGTTTIIMGDGIYTDAGITGRLTLAPEFGILDNERGFMFRGFESVNEDMKKTDVPTMLPLRGSKTSAGYDFYTPIDIEIKPQDKLLIWTDVKSYMLRGEVLLLDIRSSLGVKDDLMVANTIGVIDQDYHGNKKNDGNIGICLRNLKKDMRLAGYHKIKDIDGNIVNMPIIEDLTEQNTVRYKAGERVAQGIFMNYLPSDNCNSDEERNGGFGSTGKGEAK